MKSHHEFNPSMDWVNLYLTPNAMVELIHQLIHMSLKASYSFDPWILM
jgi:hypothetical protein